MQEKEVVGSLLISAGATFRKFRKYYSVIYITVFSIFKLAKFSLITSHPSLERWLSSVEILTFKPFDANKTPH